MRKHDAKLISRIDVSALAAILFVFAMVYWLSRLSVGHGGSSFDLPRLSHARAVPGANREDALRVAVARDGKVFFGSEQVLPEQLPSRIQEQLRQGSPARVYVRADARARYSRVLEVLRFVRLGGVQDVTFVAEERKE